MQMFDTAFVTLFHVTAGDPWPDELPMVRGTAGTPHRALGRTLTHANAYTSLPSPAVAAPLLQQ